MEKMVCYVFKQLRCVVLLLLLCVVSLGRTFGNGNMPEAGAMVRNPMLWSDVPDPDVIRVGDSFYMVSTTMHLMPGAPVMKSKDLKNWETVGYVFDRLTDSPRYNLEGGTVYGRGQWATSLKYHKGKFYALFAPNEGGAMGWTYICTAERAEGPWVVHSRLPHFHDASLFFDDDDRVYVFYGTGELVELEGDLNGVVEGSHRRLFERDAEERGLLEGSRVVKHDGRYYLLMVSHVFAPGHHRREVCYRADRLDGEWEKCVILESEFGGFGYVGQGTIVDRMNGDWYGIIFQDRGGVGRVLTVSPVRWVEGWPLIGDEEGRVPSLTPGQMDNGQRAMDGGGQGIVCSDDFGSDRLGLHWQWNHNPVDGGWSLTDRPGWLRLKPCRVVENLYVAPNTLTQRMEGPMCNGCVLLDVSGMRDGDCAGLAAFNGDSGVLTIKKEDGQLRLEMSEQCVVLTEREKAVTKVDERVVEVVEFPSGEPSGTVTEPSGTVTRVWLRIDGDFRAGQGDAANFFYSLDGVKWSQVGTRNYRMVFDYRRFFMGTKFGIFCYATKGLGGYVDVDGFEYKRWTMDN